MALIAGLDVGTTGCKITVYNPDGAYMGRVYADYPVSRTASTHEVDADAIWDAARHVLSDAAARWPGIGAIGVTSFGESFVLLDDADRPLLPVILYTDPRGAAECDGLCDAVGFDEVARITGLKPHPMYAAPKLMWIKAHRPDVYGRVARICWIADYVVYKLTGVRQIDHSLATRTMLFDLHNLVWSTPLLDAADVDAGLLPPPVPHGTSAGVVTPETARSLGIGQNVQIVSAGQDQVAAAVGSGVFDEGDAVDGAGTVECITPVFSAIPPGRAMTDGGYAIVPYVDGKYVCYAFLFTGGAAVDWFVETLPDEARAAAFKELGSDIVLDEPTGLLVLPHFAGAATPYMDYGSKAAIVGLTLASTRRDVFAGIMEGVCFEMRLNMDRLREAGLVVSKLRATGGGANSRLWMQMKADVLGVPVTSMRSPEAGGLGAAMQAGVAVGALPNLRDTAARLVVERETFVPRQELKARYDELYERYVKLYPAIRPLA